MGLFRKSSGVAPPDIGQEEKYDEEKGAAEKPNEESEEKLKKIGAKGAMPQETAREAKPVATGGGVSGVGLSNVQIESINARIDSIVEWIKQFYERFSYVSESIGEIRTMTMNNEKRLSEAKKDADKVIDVVKEVKPEELRISYQKSDMKMTTLAEKIEANKLFMDEVMKEMNDLRRKSEVFIGTEGLMKLNNDTKKDLVEIQKIGSKTRMQADKAQEIFMELRKGFADSQKVGAIVGNLDESYAGLKEVTEKLKLDYGKVVTRPDFLDFKKTYGNKLILFDANVSDVEKIKQNLSEMGDLVETSLSVSRRNEEDIGEIGLKVGATGVKKVSDYENQMMDVVGIIDTFSKQLAEIRKKVGVREVGVGEGAIKPSEMKEAIEGVAAVKVAEVPKLKPKEFLGKKNIIAKRGEVDLEEAEKKIEKTVLRKTTGDEKREMGTTEKGVKKKVVVKKVGIGEMIRKIKTRIMPEAKGEKAKWKDKEKKKKSSKKRKKDVEKVGRKGKKRKKKGSKK